MTSERRENSKSEVLPRRSTDPPNLKDVTPVSEPSWQERIGRALAAMEYKRTRMTNSKNRLT
jgi:hypothetical protein